MMDDMCSLEIGLINKPHPYPDELEAPMEAWGEVSIKITRAHEAHVLYSTKSYLYLAQINMDWL